MHFSGAPLLQIATQSDYAAQGKYYALRLSFSSIPDCLNLCLKTCITSFNFTPLFASKTKAWYITSAISEAVRAVSSFSSRVRHNSSASSLSKETRIIQGENIGCESPHKHRKNTGFHSYTSRHTSISTENCVRRKSINPLEQNIQKR